MDSFRGLVEMDREIFLAKFDLASLGRILLVDFNQTSQRQISLSSGHPVETFFCFYMSNNMRKHSTLIGYI